MTSLLLFGPPGTGQDDARADRRKYDAQALCESQRRPRGREGHPRTGGRRPRAPTPPRPGHDPVRRRGPPLQQGAAGRPPAARPKTGRSVFIGATTENPYFEVNKALVSRSRIFELQPLTQDDLRNVVRQALTDPDRGYGTRTVRLDDDALDHLVNTANGDARSLLGALELAVETDACGRRWRRRYRPRCR